MNLISAVKSYVTKMADESEPGMKALLVDKDTTSIISMVYSQTEIQQKEVYLIERIDSANHEHATPLRYLKCLVFLRPTQENLDLLCRELRTPKFGAYYVYFSNIVAKADIKYVAEHDEHETVKEVQELYMDYLAVNPHLFSLNLHCCVQGLRWNAQALQRTVQGLVSLLLSTKKSPTIRYQANSRLCEELARRVDEVLCKESSLFASFAAPAHKTPPLLLLLDRRDDPMTPLLNQWTYQAMVHELLTIHNNRVDLKRNEDGGGIDGSSGGGGGLKEVVMSAEQDAFYAKNIYLNYGEIGQNIKELMNQFQMKAKSHQKIESIADMKNFVEAYPQFKKLSGNVTKHVTVVGELNTKVNNYCLLDVSEVEQEIASQSDHSVHLTKLKKLFKSNEKIRDGDLCKLVMLYALRYQNHSNNDLNGLMALLRQRGVPDRQRQQIINIIEYAGTHARQSDFFSVETALQSTKRFFKGLSGVDNVYTQHKPLIHTILEDIAKNGNGGGGNVSGGGSGSGGGGGRVLREDFYPYVGNHKSAAGRVHDVIVFIVGGATYEESLTVHHINRTHAGFNVILGGTTIHNSSSFLRDVDAAVEGVPRTHTLHLRNVF